MLPNDKKVKFSKIDDAIEKFLQSISERDTRYTAVIKCVSLIVAQISRHSCYLRSVASYARIYSSHSRFMIFRTNYNTAYLYLVICLVHTNVDQKSLTQNPLIISFTQDNQMIFLGLFKTRLFNAISEDTRLRIFIRLSS